MRKKLVLALAVVIGIASAALTFLSWARFGTTGLSWNAFGVYTGERDEYSGTVGPPLGQFINTVPGWIVLVASIAATLALTAATRNRWLGLAAPVFALIAFVEVIACLVHPALFTGDLREFFGGGDPEQAFVNSRILIAEASTTGILLICTVFLAIDTIRHTRSATVTDSGPDT